MDHQGSVPTAAQLDNLTLSLGERVPRDGAVISRRGTGEGLVPFPNS
ncbi:hypothetical protein SBA2_450014 [Acidobacteriia bacterium SbA2]|nr:hypothetical protein SBA2_450014 [Acidobacteriia bacterium SbA2]